MTTTYYAVHDREGNPPPAQKRKLGTPAFGYRTFATAIRYCPLGGYVTMRHTSGMNDWEGRIVAHKALDGTVI